MSLLVSSTKYLRKKLYQFYTISSRRQSRRNNPYLLLLISIILITKLDENITRKLLRTQKQKVLNKMLVNQIQQDVKNIYIPWHRFYPWHVRLIQNSKINWCNHINRLMKNMIISVGAENTFNKIKW